jgi:hypothetical protein
MKRTFVVLSACFFSLFCLLSCGLEEFYYIDYIPYSVMDTTVRATLLLPQNLDYFERFIIFYRIYISDIPETALIASTTTNDIFNNQLNSSLNSDYNSLSLYTNKTSTNVNTSNLENTFYNRSYFILTLKDADIDLVLSKGSLGAILEIYFPPNPGVPPKLILNSATEFVLQRAVTGPGLNFVPKPNRDFLNHEDLYNTANVTNEINADVATNTKTGAVFRYTYVSMYIAATGKSSELPPRDIYSQPTFIGIFRLAESS